MPTLEWPEVEYETSKFYFASGKLNRKLLSSILLQETSKTMKKQLTENEVLLLALQSECLCLTS